MEVVSVDTETNTITLEGPEGGLFTTRVDRGEVLRTSGNTLFVRNARGKVVKVAVDPDFRFEVDGEEVSVFDLKPGTVLTRTAIRTLESDYVREE